MRTISKKDHETIPGIYNYCDEWCDRCPFISRCPGPVVEQDHDFPNATVAALEDKVNLLIENTERIIAHFNIPYPVVINLEGPQLSCSNKKTIFIPLLPKIQDPLVMEWNRYSGLAKKYLETYNAPDLDQKEEWYPFPFAVLDSNPMSEYNYEDVIEYYIHIVDSRLQTALHIESENVTCVDKEDNVLDSDGFIKCVVLMLDSLRDAWDQLLEKNPDSVNDMITIYLTIDQLRKKLMQRFPNCMAFVRPGLDE